MKLIDRYVTEVGKHLPRKLRTDIEAELRSTLEDMLEDRSKRARRPVDEEMEKELLKEYGAPDKVATSYNPMPYLIGPRMFPFFTMVLKIVFIVLTAVLLVMLGIQIATQPPLAAGELASTIGKGLLGILSAGIQAFGNVVLIFAILERFVPAAEFNINEEKEWDPAMLMKEPESDDVKPWEPIAGIVFTAAALIIFNFYPQIIGFTYLSDGKWTVLPALSEAFFRWMPWINLAWGLEIGLQVMLIREGRWETSTRWFSIAIKIVQIVIGYFLLSGPSITAVSPETLMAAGIFDAETSQTLGEMAKQGARSIIALVMFLEGIEAAKTIYKLITQRKPATVQ